MISHQKRLYEYRFIERTKHQWNVSYRIDQYNLTRIQLVNEQLITEGIVIILVLKNCTIVKSKQILSIYMQQDQHVKMDSMCECKTRNKSTSRPCVDRTFMCYSWCSCKYDEKLWNVSCGKVNTK